MIYYPKNCGTQTTNNPQRYCVPRKSVTDSQGGYCPKTAAKVLQTSEIAKKVTTQFAFVWIYVYLCAMNSKERNDLRKEKLAGFVYNLASLSFAGLVIGGITPLFSSNTGSVDISLIASGTITTGLLAFFANKILK